MFIICDFYRFTESIARYKQTVGFGLIKGLCRT